MTREESRKALCGSTDPIPERSDLKPLRVLLQRLGNPEKALRIIHIAGSNGKGSVAVSLQNILTLAGYKTGLHTSPHLESMNERFTIDGVQISDADYLRLSNLIRKELPLLPSLPNEFDLLTALAFLYFKEQNVDFLILEVGLGGRLDGTNVIDKKLLSIICHIGLEHTAILGNSLSEIAQEKGGIILDGTPTVLMQQSDEVMQVIRKIAKEKNSKLILTNSRFLHSYPFYLDNGYQYFTYKDRKEYALSLLGDYQLDNAMVICEAIDYLKSIGLRIPEDAVKLGLYTTEWKGRFEVLKKNPLIVLDGAHNPQAITAVVRSVEMLFPKYKKRVFFSVMQDKNYMEMLRILKNNSLSFTFFQVDSVRGVDACTLKELWEKEFDGDIHLAKSLEDGLQWNFENLRNEEGKALLLCVGSLYQVSGIRRYCRENL